jgi:hypothetical protein
MKNNDEARVRKFMEVWGIEADGIRIDLLALLRLVRIQERRGAAKSDRVVLAVSRAERRVRDLLARRAPIGTVITPELLSSVNHEVLGVVIEELSKGGMSEPMVTTLSMVLAASLAVRPKVGA